MAVTRKGKMHAYDFHRSCLEGTRTICGRVTDDVRWTSDERRVTCARCRRRTARAIITRVRREAARL